MSGGTGPETTGRSPCPAAGMRTDELDRLGEAHRTVLRSLYVGRPQLGADGRPHPIDDTTRISIADGMALFSSAVESHVTASLEVGLAYGFSTVYLLAALETNGGGTHTAIDPYQTAEWHGIGARHAAELTSRPSAPAAVPFELIEDRSARALVDLERAGRRFGLVFIDGYHRFDDVLIDFTLSARLLEEGGLVVFHDVWLDGIKAAASFVRCDRGDFTEVAVPCDDLCVFRRTGDDTRDWRHFVAFPMR